MAAIPEKFTSKLCIMTMQNSGRYPKNLKSSKISKTFQNKSEKLSQFGGKDEDVVDGGDNVDDIGGGDDETEDDDTAENANDVDFEGSNGRQPIYNLSGLSDSSLDFLFL